MVDLPEGCFDFYWLVTIKTNDGVRITCDGTIPADAQHHTRMSTARTLMNQLREEHGGFTVLAFDLQPNSLIGLA